METHSDRKPSLFTLNLETGELEPGIPLQMLDFGSIVVRRYGVSEPTFDGLSMTVGMTSTFQRRRVTEAHLGWHVVDKDIPDNGRIERHRQLMFPQDDRPATFLVGIPASKDTAPQPLIGTRMSSTHVIDGAGILPASELWPSPRTRDREAFYVLRINQMLAYEVKLPDGPCWIIQTSFVRGFPELECLPSEVFLERLKEPKAVNRWR